MARHLFNTSSSTQGEDRMHFLGQMSESLGDKAGNRGHRMTLKKKKHNCVCLDIAQQKGEISFFKSKIYFEIGDFALPTIQKELPCCLLSYSN